MKWGQQLLRQAGWLQKSQPDRKREHEGVHTVQDIYQTLSSLLNVGNVHPSCHTTQQSLKSWGKTHHHTTVYAETPQLFKEDCTFQQQIKSAKKVGHKEKMKNHRDSHAKTNSALLSTALAPEGRTQPQKWVLMNCQMTGEAGNGLVSGSSEGGWH